MALRGSHHEIVNELVGEMTGPRQDPLVAMIHAEAGWGKTRVVQELYDALVAKQPAGQQYFLGVLAPDNTRLEMLREWRTSRKRVAPGPDGVDASCEPGFLWLGAGCATRASGTALSVAEVDLIPQLLAHTAARRARAGLEGLLGKTALELAIEVAGQFAAEALPGAGALGGLKTVYEAARDFHGRSRVPSTDFADHEESVRQEVHDLFVDQVVASLDRHPVVVVLDDAHLVDTQTLRLIDRLFHRLEGQTVKNRLTVMLTAWPHAVGGSPLETWLEDLSQSIAKLNWGPADLTLSAEEALEVVAWPGGFDDQTKARAVEQATDAGRVNAALLHRHAAQIAEDTALFGSDGMDEEYFASLQGHLHAEAQSRFESVSPDERRLAMFCGSFFGPLFPIEFLPPTWGIALSGAVDPVRSAGPMAPFSEAYQYVDEFSYSYAITQHTHPLLRKEAEEGLDRTLDMLAALGPDAPARLVAAALRCIDKVDDSPVRRVYRRSDKMASEVAIAVNRRAPPAQEVALLRRESLELGHSWVGALGLSTAASWTMREQPEETAESLRVILPFLVETPQPTSLVRRIVTQLVRDDPTPVTGQLWSLLMAVARDVPGYAATAVARAGEVPEKHRAAWAVLRQHAEAEPNRRVLTAIRAAANAAPIDVPPPRWAEQYLPGWTRPSPRRQRARNVLVDPIDVAVAQSRNAFRECRFEDARSLVLPHAHTDGRAAEQLARVSRDPADRSAAARLLLPFALKAERLVATLALVTPPSQREAVRQVVRQNGWADRIWGAIALARLSETTEQMREAYELLAELLPAREYDAWRLPSWLFRLAVRLGDDGLRQASVEQLEKHQDRWPRLRVDRIAFETDPVARTASLEDLRSWLEGPPEKDDLREVFNRMVAILGREQLWSVVDRGSETEQQLEAYLRARTNEDSIIARARLSFRRKELTVLGELVAIATRTQRARDALDDLMSVLPRGA